MRQHANTVMSNDLMSVKSWKHPQYKSELLRLLQPLKHHPPPF